MNSISPKISTGTDSSMVKVSASLANGKIDATTSKTEGTANNPLFKTKNKMDKMDFLKLLTTQLKYQDPMNPTNNTEFIAQLAQFSALEGTNNVEAALSNLDKSFKETLSIQQFNALSMTNASAVGLIGKNVSIREDSIVYNGQPQKIQVHIGNKSSTSLQIVNDKGECVRTLPLTGKDSTNSASVVWDGLTELGQNAPLDTYKLLVTGQDSDPQLYCFSQDIVQGIHYTENGPLLKVGKKEMPLGNIMDIAPNSQTAESKNAIVEDSMLLSLLGKKARYRKQVVTYTPQSNKSLAINVNLAGFTSTQLQVTDKQGNIVQNIKVSSDDGGVVKVPLECIDYNGNGPYSLQLIGNSSSYMFDEGTIDAFSKQNGKSQIRINGMNIAYEDIFDVSVVKES